MKHPQENDGYLPRPISAPRQPLPPGAWDCHSHVFGPFDRFPIRPGHRYRPPEAAGQDYAAMLAGMGFANGSLVHPSSAVHDNTSTLEAVAQVPARVVAVAVPAPESSDAELERLHQAGVRAVRFAPAREVEDQPGTLDFTHLAQWAPRLAELGWHAQIHHGLAGIVAHLPLFASLPVPVVFDHLAGAKPADDPHGKDFSAFLEYARDHDTYVKLTLRVASKAPDFADVRALHDLLVEDLPDQVIYGSDWPFINRRTDAPLTGTLVDVFDAWVPDATLRQKVFVDTPLRLFGAI
ncbi:MAG: amidohydrolase family protein [Rhodobacteraceae bacterium]|jgi:2-pyrone-4,6-dicarboxylate lactonase|nr:amidohydrolase family protein [Paracoccaceae bacterium]